MRDYSLSHASDEQLTQGLSSLVAHDRVTTARLLAHVAEFDTRRLYLPAAFPSMFAYCVHDLRLSEDAAYKRIQAARVARQFPSIFPALADGRLHLTGVLVLSTYLTPENAEDLLAAAAHKTKGEIEAVLAQRFPRSETMPLVEALPGTPRRTEAAIAADTAQDVAALSCQLAPERVTPPSKVAPVAPGRFRLELTIGRGTHDKLQRAQELLAHQIPSGDIVQVLDRALGRLIELLERQKLAATTKPHRRVCPTTNPRHLPAHVKRAVWERDGGQCTFVSEAGRRCASRTRLEFDHVEPVARGGRATVTGIRLRCRAHDQYTAECAFGAEFMRQKREEARRRAEARRQEAAARETVARKANEARRVSAAARAADVAGHQAAARARTAADEVVTPLRLLGFRTDEARRAAALCEDMPEASLEQRVRRALSYLGPRARTVAPAAMSPQSAPSAGRPPTSFWGRRDGPGRVDAMTRAAVGRGADGGTVG